MDKIEAVKAVDRMQHYIENHLEDTISMQALARVSGYSLWHAVRLFKTYTHKTPFEYIRALRLSRAAMIFRDEAQSVIDVAFHFEFDSHEGFTRAFSKQFGFTPSHYKKKHPPVKLFIPYSVKDYYLYQQKRSEIKMEKDHVIFTQVVKKEARALILKRGEAATDYFAYCEEVGCEVWGELVSIKEAISEPAGYWLPKTMQNGKSEYVQGVEVALNCQSEVPKGFEKIVLDESYYLVFQGEPYEEDEIKFMDAIHTVQEAIKRYKPKTYGYELSHQAPRFQLEPQGARGYIEAIPVVPLKGTMI